MTVEPADLVSLSDRFLRVGPGMESGVMAYDWECLTCDYVLVTVAATDLTDENRAILEDHWAAAHTGSRGDR